MTLAVNPAFIAAGGSRHPAAADWSSYDNLSPRASSTSSLVAFGAGVNVALWHPNAPDRRGVHALLRASHGSINAVRFMKLADQDSLLLLTGSSDGVVQAWTLDHSSPTGFTLAAEILPESNPPLAINAIAVLPEAHVFVVATAHARIHVCSVQLHGTTASISLQQQFKLSPLYFALALDIAILDQEHIILVAAGTRIPVQVFTSPRTTISFQPVASLTGHEAWIRSLAFTRESDDPASDIILASASQDKYVRLWRFHQGEELPALSQTASDPLLGSVKKSLSNKAHRFETGGLKYSITFEALLVGHEDWIFSARWSRHNGQLSLLTASADNSLSVWRLDPSSGIWIAAARLGDISAQKGATTATGSAGGFWTGLWAPSGDAVACLGRTGSWRLWRQGQTVDEWTDDFGVTGHTASVRDVAWSKDGTYLLSTSADQTTRLFSEWKRQGVTSWHEVSRPQIHGYDLNCIASLTNNQFVSGADEKLLRVFDEPRPVAAWLESLAGRSSLVTAQLPEVANIPVLGLSNKAVDLESSEHVKHDQDQDEIVETHRNHTTLDDTDAEKTPPTEDLLSKHLLWPEREKLYGHGYEICAVAANSTGALIATACRATSVDHAVIRLYDTSTWLEVKPPLKAHTLTVTALEFSPDDRYLTSVGRDRQCVVWERSDSQLTQYTHLASNPKAHTRMILGVSWLGSLAGASYFATAGRDKAVHVWTLDGSGLDRRASLTASCPVMAVCFLPSPTDGKALLAYGLEDGSVLFAWFNPETSSLSEPYSCVQGIVPAAPVTSLAWRPSPHPSHNQSPAQVAQLAIASEDMALRIFDVALEEA